MKRKQDKGKPERLTPRFATEVEEADWWFEHRDEHAKQLLAAVKKGEARRLTTLLHQALTPRAKRKVG
jgi:hypothetical protein